jgi:phosphatidylinositol glycan class W
MMGAVNRNQLAFFLVANVATGVVNLAMQTIYAPPKTALTVILGYMLGLMLVFVALDRRRFTLKFW